MGGTGPVLAFGSQQEIVSAVDFESFFGNGGAGDVAARVKISPKICHSFRINSITAELRATTPVSMVFS